MECIIRDCIVHHMTHNDLFADAHPTWLCSWQELHNKLLQCMEGWTNLLELHNTTITMYGRMDKFTGSA